MGTSLQSLVKQSERDEAIRPVHTRVVSILSGAAPKQAGYQYNTGKKKSGAHGLPFFWLMGKHIGSRPCLSNTLQVKAAVREAKAGLENARLRLAYTEIKAPLPA